MNGEKKQIRILESFNIWAALGAAISFLALAALDFLWLPAMQAAAALALLIGFFAALFFLRRPDLAPHAPKAEENELQSIVYSLEDALIAYDQNFKVFFFNPAAERMFGIPREHIVGEMVQPQDAERPDRRLLTQVIFPSLAPTLAPRSKAGTYPQIVDISFTNPVRELRVITAPVSEGGKMFGFVKIVRDRTREIGLLRQKSEFVTVASHQLRTPISEISWALESLRKSEGLSAEEREILERTLNSTQGLMHIVESLLLVAKEEEGRFGYDFATASYPEFLGNILSAATPQAEHTGVKLYFDRPKEPIPDLTIDADKIAMVVTNLLDNAIRYNVPNGQVIVTVKKAADGPFVETSVKDTGIGIPGAELEKIFTKFFRASNAIRFQTEGSGLGLYIAKNIIEAHGGQMWAESEVNRGTTFFFTLPTDPTLIPPHEVPVEY